MRVCFKTIKAFFLLTPALFSVLEHLISIDADDTQSFACMCNYSLKTALTVIYSILVQVGSSFQVT